ncbi:hypothetical protein FB451DRAFT_1532851 [Mycena latifolia]|nr:hypothetical protein FB451DRAFT_1532851 [Mycena latifolia]
MGSPSIRILDAFMLQVLPHLLPKATVSDNAGPYLHVSPRIIHCTRWTTLLPPLRYQLCAALDLVRAVDTALFDDLHLIQFNYTDLMFVHLGCKSLLSIDDFIHEMTRRLIQKAAEETAMRASLKFIDNSRLPFSFSCDVWYSSTEYDDPDDLPDLIDAADDARGVAARGGDGAGGPSRRACVMHEAWRCPRARHATSIVPSSRSGRASDRWRRRSRGWGAGTSSSGGA